MSENWPPPGLAAPPGAAMTLLCAICLYVSEDVALPAVTVIGGMAVCEGHADHAQDDVLGRIIGQIGQQRRREREQAEREA
jgi:hypothetical protein